MDIVQERLEREYGIDLILTAPSVIYHVHLTDGTMLNIDNPSKLPDSSKISYIEEPYVTANIMTPKEYIGPIMELCQERRGIYKDLQYFDATRNILIYELPLAEIVYNFFDKLKSYTKGYASFDYEIIGYRKTDLVRVDILVNGEACDALSMLVFKDNAVPRGRQACERLQEEIPRHQFKIPIQAAIGGNIIARETINAFRKDVTAKCYGGDMTRKRKLLEKQKEGKKRMKLVGNVEIPQSAYLAVLKSKSADE